MGEREEPVRVAVIDDYEVVLAGVARMLDRYRDRVEVIEIDARTRVAEPVDVALYDTFAQPSTVDRALPRMVANPRSRHVVVYTWSLRADLIEVALRDGAHGYLSKSLSAPELVTALERVSAGEVVTSEPRARVGSAVGLDWPGRREGLSDRESEVLALITQGKRNPEIATLTHLSPNTIKTHIRSIFRKTGASDRVEALLWGQDHGFRPDHRSVEHWNGD